MINGKVTEFVDHIYYGDELIFMYNGQKFFLQGLPENGILVLYLERWEPPAEDYIWSKAGTAKNYPTEDFLNAKIRDGKSFWEVESQMEWIDS